MSGKFKKDVARSQTLSQISSFSVAEGNCAEVEFDRSRGSYLSNSDAFQKNLKTHDFSQALPNSKRIDSLRLSPCQAKSLSSNLNNLMKNLDIMINASSEYDLDKESVLESRESLEQDADQPQVNQAIKQNYQQKDSLFKQSYTTNLQKKLKSSLFSANQLENSLNIIGIPANLATSQEQSQDQRFNQIIDTLKIPQNTQGLQGSLFGSNYSSKQFKESDNFKERDCSIIYNSCQIDMSCSVSMRIANQSKRLYQNQQQNLQKNNSLAEEDEDNSMLSSNPQYKSNSRLLEQQKEIVKEYTESTISKLNYLSNKINEFESLENSDLQLQKKTAKYISKRLRLLKRAPFASIELSTSLVASSISQGNSLSNYAGVHGQGFISNEDFQTFHSNTPSIVKRNPHYISKISLDIDYLHQKDICLTSEEFYTFVLPLDPHFPNVILVGTLSGKIQLHQLTKEKPRKKYILKMSQQIFPQAKKGEQQIFASCATQFKSNFYIGGSDGSLHFYDFKKKAVVNSMENKNSIPVDCFNLEESVSINNEVNHLNFGSDEKAEQEIKTPFAVKNIRATQKKIILSRQDSMVIIVKSSDLNETLYQKRIEGLIKCDFSCDNDNNIVILTDEKLEVIHTPSSKTIFRMKPNIQEQLVYVDFQVNKLTKEIILLSNNQLMQESKIEILRNSTTKLRVIDSLRTQYVINSILLDRSMQNMFCVSQNEIKIWNFFNQIEFQSIQQALLDKISDHNNILTSNDSCN